MNFNKSKRLIAICLILVMVLLSFTYVSAFVRGDGQGGGQASGSVYTAGQGASVVTGGSSIGGVANSSNTRWAIPNATDNWQG